LIGVRAEASGEIDFVDFCCDGSSEIFAISSVLGQHLVPRFPLFFWIATNVSDLTIEQALRYSHGLSPRSQVFSDLVLVGSYESA